MFRQILGFILLVATVGLATCQSVVKADPTADVKAGYPVTAIKS
jgi:hypothetical protein